MNLNLKVDGFENYVLDTKKIYDGVQVIFRFENQYGASVVKHEGSLGHGRDRWELAVIRFESKDKHDKRWTLNRDTPITNDVIGFLTNDEVLELLKQIKEL